MGDSNKKMARKLGGSKKLQRDMQRTNDNPPVRGPKKGKGKKKGK